VFVCFGVDEQRVMKSLHCYSPVERQKKLVHLLASMCTYEILFKDDDDGGDGDEAAAKRGAQPVRHLCY